MSTGKWILKIDGTDEILGTFKAQQECVDAALKLITERFTDTSKIVREVLKQRHTKTCRALIKPFLDLSALGNVDIPSLFWDVVGDCTGSIEENLFWTEATMGIYCFRFGKDRDLYIEARLWDKDEGDYYVYVSTPTDRVRFSIYNVIRLPATANIFLVYQALTTTPRSRKELQWEIAHTRKGRHDGLGYECSGYDTALSEDTISNQIHALRDLGIPIRYKQLSHKEKIIKEALIREFGSKYKEGFYIDYNAPITPDYSKCTPRSYPMLVYLTLKEIDKAHALLTQQDIVRAVQARFGITLQRQKVKNYIEILNDLDAQIQHDDAGYWMKKSQ